MNLGVDNAKPPTMCVVCNAMHEGGEKNQKNLRAFLAKFGGGLAGNAILLNGVVQTANREIGGPG